jgi:hypothetical protein
MKSTIHKMLLPLIALCALPSMALATVGTVSLIYSPSSSDLTSPGSSVTLSLSLVVSGFSGSDAVGGVDFLLTSLNSTSGAFFIQSRTTDTNGAFSDPITDDATVATRPGSNLNPTNDSDLGQAVATFPADVVQNGTFHLADYVIGVDAGVAPGTYNFTTTVNLWSDQNGADHSLTNPGTFSLVVVPEPATCSLLALGALATVGLKLVRRRRTVA